MFIIQQIAALISCGGRRRTFRSINNLPLYSKKNTVKNGLTKIQTKKEKPKYASFATSFAIKEKYHWLWFSNSFILFLAQLWTHQPFSKQDELNLYSFSNENCFTDYGPNHFSLFSKPPQFFGHSIAKKVHYHSLSWHTKKSLVILAAMFMCSLSPLFKYLSPKPVMDYKTQAQDIQLILDFWWLR